MSTLTAWRTDPYALYGDAFLNVEAGEMPKMVFSDHHALTRDHRWKRTRPPTSPARETLHSTARTPLRSDITRLRRLPKSLRP